VIDSIKELFQIEIDYPSVALRDVLLRVCTENLIRVDDVMESPKLAE
jgi:hypothetical protein